MTSTPKGKKSNIATIQRLIYLILTTISVLMSGCLFFTPFCLFHGAKDPLTGLTYTESISPSRILVLLANGLGQRSIVYYIGFGVFCIWAITFAVMVSRYIGLLTVLRGKRKAYVKRCREICLTSTVLVGLYYLGGIIYTFIDIAAKGHTSPANNIFPLVVALVIDLGMGVYIGLLGEHITIEKPAPDKEKILRRTRFEMMIYLTALLGMSIGCFFSKIIAVSFKDEALYLGGPLLSNMDFSLNGMDILKKYSSLDTSGQTLAFLLLLLLTVVLSFYLSAMIAGVSRSRMFFRLSLGTVISCMVGCFMIGMYGKVYEMIQETNIDFVLSLLPILEELGIGGEEGALHDCMKVKSEAYIWFLFACAFASVILIRRPYSKGTVLENELYGPKTAAQIEKADIAITEVSAVEESSTTSPASAVDAGTNEPYDHDPCPSFSELDALAPQVEDTIREKKRSAFESPTLPALVSFIVQYARNSSQHLIYTEEDIAAFIAGLGMTKLTILQGMSGTGKTSLPKIFAEALLSGCDIIEVESSWRDKNELLGYYNEFSKIYSPKNFTLALYQARLHPEQLTFIVLDEMNLSRIEYYFSDFLSLMENEPDARKIKLLNIALHRKVKGNRVPYAGLVRGHTLKIPPNVWFIGTANRDESTFEISDKVYDRAHTMNFSKRAKSTVHYAEQLTPRYLSSPMLNAMFEKAIAQSTFKVDTYPLIAEVEKLLQPYHISFGNRVANQMERFVAIYCACFGASDKVVFAAVERILLSKVVSKLERKSIENKSRLAAEFEHLGLHDCSDFILSLDED